ncbi:MAG: hypothetical protein COA94_08470 [Rickettsiales bacterium]|nr:MAG: hypothetical protein COA94_08470 [Rickettsiales bacterium]
MHKVLYKKTKEQSIDRHEDGARDCVDLAVKLILELDYQYSSLQGFKELMQTIYKTENSTLDYGILELIYSCNRTQEDVMTVMKAASEQISSLGSDHAGKLIPLKHIPTPRDFASSGTAARHAARNDYEEAHHLLKLICQYSGGKRNSVQVLYKLCHEALIF